MDNVETPADRLARSLAHVDMTITLSHKAQMDKLDAIINTITALLAHLQRPL